MNSGRNQERQQRVGAHQASEGIWLSPDNPRVARKVRRKRRLRSMCGQFTVRAVEHNHRTHLYRVNCKCWSCKRCGPKKAARYKHVIREQAVKHRLRRFLTLTLDPKKLNGADPVPYLRLCWAKFRVYLRRKYGESPKYICVLEFQKSGTPHLHVLLDRYIEQAWIKEVWQSLGGGEHVDIRLVDLHRVSRYLSKYLTKELLMSAPKRSRRVTTSQGIQLNEKRESGIGDLLRVPIRVLYRRFQRMAKDVVRDQDEVTIQSFTLEFVLT